MEPASLQFFVTVDSYGGIKFSNILDAHVVFFPSVQKISLWAIGIPPRGLSLNSSKFASIFDARSNAYSSK